MSSPVLDEDMHNYSHSDLDAEEERDVARNGSKQKSSKPSKSAKPMKDVVAIIDVRSSEDTNAHENIKKQLEEMGGSVKKIRSKNVTHAIVLTSDKKIFDWAKTEDKKVVSPQWLFESKSKGEKLDEDDFRATLVKESAQDKKEKETARKQTPVKHDSDAAKKSSAKKRKRADEDSDDKEKPKKKAAKSKFTAPRGTDSEDEDAAEKKPTTTKKKTKQTAKPLSKKDEDAMSDDEEPEEEKPKKKTATKKKTPAKKDETKKDTDSKKKTPAKKSDSKDAKKDDAKKSTKKTAAKKDDEDKKDDKKKKTPAKKATARKRTPKKKEEDSDVESESDLDIENISEDNWQGTIVRSPKRPPPRETAFTIEFSSVEFGEEEEEENEKLIKEIDTKRKIRGGIKLGEVPFEGDRFTHLVLGDENKRSLKVLFAIAFGANIVTQEWWTNFVEHLKSHKDDKKVEMLSVDDYIVDRWQDASNACRELSKEPEEDEEESNAKDRQTKLLEGKTVSFHHCGDNTPLFEALAKALGATVTRAHHRSQICIIDPKGEPNETCLKAKSRVTTKWLSDSIEKFKLQPFKDYAIDESAINQRFHETKSKAAAGTKKAATTKKPAAKRDGDKDDKKITTKKAAEKKTTTAAKKDTKKEDTKKVSDKKSTETKKKAASKKVEKKAESEDEDTMEDED